jgi:DNA-binding NtrC family response regulator
VERLIAKREIEAAAETLVAIGASYEDAKELLVNAVVNKALEVAGGNKCKAARMLKVHRNTFTRLLGKTA